LPIEDLLADTPVELDQLRVDRERRARAGRADLALQALQ
jgi:hypothetical protein